MARGFLSKVVPLASLFASGVWAQLDMAECKPGWEWVRSLLGFWADVRVNTATECPTGCFYGGVESKFPGAGCVSHWFQDGCIVSGSW